MKTSFKVQYDNWFAIIPLLRHNPCMQLILRSQLADKSYLGKEQLTTYVFQT